MALLIVESYPYLVEERDQSSMTALQYLACNPTAFRRGKIQIRQGFMELLNKSMLLDKQKIEMRGARGGLAQLFRGICIVYFIPSSTSSNNYLLNYSYFTKKENFC